MSLASWLPGGLASSAESNDTTNMSDTDRNNADSASVAGTSSTATAPAPAPVSKLDDVVNSTAHHELVKTAITAAAETRDEASYLELFKSGLKIANIRALAGAVYYLQRKLVETNKTNRELEDAVTKARANNADNFVHVKHKGVGKKSKKFPAPTSVVTKNPFQALLERDGEEEEVNNVDTAPAVCPSVKERNEALCTDKTQCALAHPEQCRDYDNCWPTRRPECTLWHLSVPLSVHYKQIKERRRLEREKLKKVSATLRQAHEKAGNGPPRGHPGVKGNRAEFERNFPESYRIFLAPRVKEPDFLFLKHTL